MASSNIENVILSSLTNDEIKRRIMKIYAKFVSDVQPTPLCDWLIQEKVITFEQWEAIRNENPTTQSQCRALLRHLFSIQHPRAFVIVREALGKEGHYLLEIIDNQEPQCELLEPPASQTVVQERVHQAERDAASTAAGTSETEPLLSRLQENQDQLGDPERAQKLQEINCNIILKKIRNIALIATGGVVLLVSVMFVTIYTSLGKPRCMSDPVYLQTIRTKAAEEKKNIIGLTILDKELFVVCGESSEIDVYDSIKFSFSRRMNLKELIVAQDMVSCNINKCLYIVDYKGSGKTIEILRVDPNGNLIMNWSVGYDVGRLSVTDEANVIFTGYEYNELREFSPYGQLIRTIKLSPDAGIRHPRHAIKLTNGNFVVSHGLDPEDLHRVCIVDADGNLTKSFGGKRGSGIGQMNDPVYLSICGNGFVMVADYYNGRILLLDSDLKFKRETISNQTNGLRLPTRILLNESNCRLFVADNELNNPRVLIFDLK